MFGPTLDFDGFRDLSSSPPRAEGREISRAWPEYFRRSPTPTVVAYVIETCSLYLSPKGLAISPM